MLIHVVLSLFASPPPRNCITILLLLDPIAPFQIYDCQLACTSLAGGGALIAIAKTGIPPTVTAGRLPELPPPLSGFLTDHLLKLPDRMNDHDRLPFNASAPLLRLLDAFPLKPR